MTQKIPNTESVEDVLNFAIEREEESYKFYIDLAAKMKKPVMKKVFEDFAKEEIEHKKKLQEFKKDSTIFSSTGKINDLQISNYLVDIQPSPDIEYRDALVIAMKKEKAAFKLYTDMAMKITNSNVQSILFSFAEEEAKHKLRFEIEYDENFLTEKGY